MKWKPPFAQEHAERVVKLHSPLPTISSARPTEISWSTRKNIKKLYALPTFYLKLEKKVACLANFLFEIRERKLYSLPTFLFGIRSLSRILFSLLRLLWSLPLALSLSLGSFPIATTFSSLAISLSLHLLGSFPMNPF